jgi:hypothetical protein
MPTQAHSTDTRDEIHPLRRNRRHTPAARALVGCLALQDGATLNEAIRLAGYENKAATPVTFLRGRCYRPSEVSGRRVVTRNGRIVAVTGSALAQSLWMLRLGRKLAALAGAGRRAA